MAKWKDDNEYRTASNSARDGMTPWALKSPQANDYSRGWDHVMWGTGRGYKEVRREGELTRVPVTGPGPPPRPHAEGEVVKPPRTPAFTRGVVHGLMWRRRNPRFY